MSHISSCYKYINIISIVIVKQRKLIIYSFSKNSKWEKAEWFNRHRKTVFDCDIVASSTTGTESWSYFKSKNLGRHFHVSPDVKCPSMLRVPGATNLRNTKLAVKEIWFKIRDIVILSTFFLSLFHFLYCTSELYENLC